MTSTNGMPVAGSQTAVATTAWTSATALNTANTISVVGMNTVTVAMSNTSTMTAGVLTFEVSPDSGTTWFPIQLARIDSYTVEATYTLSTVATRAWSTSVDGFTNFRGRLSTVITGTGTANLFVTAQTMPIEPIVTVGQSAAALMNVTTSRDMQRIAVTSASLTTATTAYTSGDQVGAQLTFANAARASGGSGMIVGCVLISAADITGPYDIVITDSSITLAADNAAFAISDADALKIVGLVPMSGAYDIGNNRIAQIYNLAMPYVCSGGTSLFGGLITRSGHTFFAAATDLQVDLYVERN